MRHYIEYLKKANGIQTMIKDIAICSFYFEVVLGRGIEAYRESEYEKVQNIPLPI